MADVLTARQHRFVDEYLVDLNATQAAIRAGYSQKYAGQNADKLLKNTNIADAIQARRAKVSEKLEITQERVLQELAAIAFADATDYVNVEMERANEWGIHPITGEVCWLPTGWRQYVKVIDTKDLPKRKRAALAGIKQGLHGIEIKLHDKQRALEQLGKHLNLFSDESRGALPEVKIILERRNGNNT